MKVIHNNTAVVCEIMVIDDDGDVVQRERPQVVMEKFSAEAFQEAYAHFAKVLQEMRDNAASNTSD